MGRLPGSISKGSGPPACRRTLEALSKMAAVYPDAGMRAATDDQGQPPGLELARSGIV
jgi:hypothetical protein